MDLKPALISIIHIKEIIIEFFDEYNLFLSKLPSMKQLEIEFRT